MITSGGVPTSYVITTSGHLTTPRQVNAAINAIKHSNASGELLLVRYTTT